MESLKQVERGGQAHGEVAAEGADTKAEPAYGAGGTRADRQGAWAVQGEGRSKRVGAHGADATRPRTHTQTHTDAREESTRETLGDSLTRKTATAGFLESPVSDMETGPRLVYP